MSDFPPIVPSAGGWELRFERLRLPHVSPLAKRPGPTMLLVLSLIVGLATLGCTPPASTVVPNSPTSLPTVAPPTATPVPPTATVPVPTPTPTQTPVPKVLAFGHPSTVRQGTDATEHLAPDGYPWARYRPVLVDKYGKILVWAQKAAGAGDGPVRPVVSSDGVSWTEPSRHGFDDDQGENGFFGPPMVAYDSADDLLHSLWSTGSNPQSGGIVYRRYTIERDAAHNAIGLTRVASLSLDRTGTDYGPETQSLLWLNDEAYGSYGALLAVWSASNSKGAPNKTELRSSMVVLGGSATTADTAKNWVAPIAADSTTISSTPAVAYSRILATTGGAMFPAVYRKLGGANAKDVYVVFPESSRAGYSIKVQRLRWSAATNNWKAGVTDPISLTPILRGGSDAGYSGKYQLLSQMTEDLTDDLLAIAFSTWKDRDAGDTWSFVTIDPKNGDAGSKIFDVYEAGAAQSSADAFVAGDITWDRATNLFVVAYGDLPRKDGYIAAYRPGGDLALSPVRFHDASPIDIPVLVSSRIDGRIAMIYRDYNPSARDQPPTYDPTKGYHGWFSTMDLGLVPVTG